MKLTELTAFSSACLDLPAFVAIDDSLNGLQVGRPGKEVHKVVCAVDATLATFKQAAREQADAVFVHHGLFWGKSLAITETHYERIACLLENDIALLAAHLPLDAHPVLGNNATMARLLGVVDPVPFGAYHGKMIGFRGELGEPLDVEKITRRLGFSPQTGLRILPFGKKTIRTVGIVSGGAAFDVQQAIDLGLDAYITGESSHTMYAVCLEAGMTMVCGGHYASEVFGVQEMGKLFASELGLDTSFIALPTAL